MVLKQEVRHMEANILEKPAIKLIGLSTNVTLYDVQQNKTTIKLAANFLQRRSEIRIV
jgi:AraC family transcriptional regulator